MAKPRLSVIVPCRDEASHLERTLCSVIDQGYDDVELLVADGGSSDDTLAIIRDYADQIAWWHSGPDTGPADAINMAMQHVTGDIVGILHAGDLYLPGALDAVGRRMTDADDACHWLAGHCICIDTLDRERGRLDAAMPLSAVGFLMHDSGQLPPSAVFYRRSLLARHGAFDVRCRFAWDYEMHARLVMAGHRPTVLGQVLAAHREGADGPDRMERTLRHGMEYIEIAERFGEHLSIKQQYGLWRNCDERRRIYTLAEAEMAGDDARRRLWERLLRRPWWLASAAYRRMLLQERDHRGRGDGKRTTRRAA